MAKGKKAGLEVNQGYLAALIIVLTLLVLVLALGVKITVPF